MKALKLSLFVVVLFILFLLVFKICTDLIREQSFNTYDIVYDVTYTNDEGNACLTFYKNGKYSMYDCDSEPTDYFFDSENECTYSYKKDYIYFDCRYNYSNLKDNKIKILSWNKQEITFKYGNKTETFKAK